MIYPIVPPAHNVFQSQVVVVIAPKDFLSILQLEEQPFVIHDRPSIILGMGKYFRYLTPYRGVLFLTKVTAQLKLPSHCHIVEAKHLKIQA